jgi:CIC family chloride channel protein
MLHTQAAWMLSRWRFIRRLARKDELFLLALAAATGAVVGGGVVAQKNLVALVQYFTFGVSVDHNPMLATLYGWWRPLLVPVVGGLAYGIGIHFVRRTHPQEIVDAIEANALHGGRMSFTDSLIIVAMTIASVGVGASVGLEASVVQMGSGFCSWLGQYIQVKRSSLRTMVGCGAAAAIAAAFNAPLAGTFYALELVVGGYAVTALAPILVAAVAGTVVARSALGAAPLWAVVREIPSITGTEYLVFIVIGVLASGLGILMMRIATMFEAAYRRWSAPQWLRPAIGGSILGIMALFFPAVLGSGHGALDAVVNQQFTLPILIGLVGAKTLASAVSIGSGFRGGLFSASVFLGGLFGGATGWLAAIALPGIPFDYTSYALVGMGAVATAVVGAPLTMILLVFETTANYSVAIGVIVGVLVASSVTRRWFGYSFSTWRFHLRGMDLRGSSDIGRLRDLSVREVLDRNVLRVPATTDLDTLCSLFLLGTAKVAFIEKADGTYAGMAESGEANAALLEDDSGRATAGSLVSEPPHYLTAEEALLSAFEMIESSRHETLPVVVSVEEPRVIGCVHKADVLRRYFEELDRMRIEDLGDIDIFNISTPRASRESDGRH